MLTAFLNEQAILNDTESSLKLDDYKNFVDEFNQSRSVFREGFVLGVKKTNPHLLKMISFKDIPESESNTIMEYRPEVKTVKGYIHGGCFGLTQKSSGVKVEIIDYDNAESGEEYEYGADEEI